jgi:peptidoglycan/xylan/chitin deacetylase (PgdA/CDA1 family)
MQRKLALHVQHGISRLLHIYADLRIGATRAEKCCHKMSDTVLLTFDDFGSSQEVDELLAILANKRVRAIMFLIGNWAEQNSDLVQRIARGGHILGNHTYSHRNLLKLSDREVTDEIKRGLPGRWLRAPQGRSNRRIRKLAGRQGFSLCYWTIDSRDWTGASVNTMRHTILTELHPGAVILFHLNGKNTRQLLPGLIDEIRARGYLMTSFAENW